MAETPHIVVVDYHKGNLSSVVRGLARAGADAVASDAPEDILASDGIVLPGVGSFFDAITFMREAGQDACNYRCGCWWRGYSLLGDLPGAPAAL